jgi:signal transduction histidine kinase
MAAEWISRLTLRARLTLVASILVAGALATGAILLSEAVHRALVTGVDESARQRAQDVALLIDTGRLPDPIPVEAGTPLVQVVDADDRVVAASPGGDQLVPILLPRDVDAVRAGESRTVPGSRLGQADDLHVVGREAGEGRSLTVLVAMSLSDAQGALRVVRTVLFGGAPLLVGSFAIACWLLVGQALRPVGALRRGAQEITSTREQRRLPVPAAEDEVHRLAVTLNDMLDRLERSDIKQRSFVSDAAHELRSPLTAIRAQLEIGQVHPDSTDWRQTTADALADVERLSRLIDDLLILARIDERPVRRLEQVDVAQVADDMVDRYDVSDVDVSRVGESSIVIDGDVDAISRIIANLVDNAVLHAASAVSVGVHRTDSSVELVVADDGPGIPEQDRERVFDRFTRLDTARSRDAGGTGLGLSIVRELARAQGGSVELTDDGPGLRAIVQFPS